MARLTSLSCGLLLAGCANLGSMDLAKTVAIPEDLPAISESTFTPAHVCMDNKLRESGLPKTYLTIDSIIDHTGTVPGDFSALVLHALAEMSATSGAFQVVHGGAPSSLTRTGPVDFYRALWTLNKGGRILPNYYIRGGVTQIDRSLVRQSESGGLTVTPNPSVSIGPGANRQYGATHITFSLELVEYPYEQSKRAVRGSMVFNERGKGLDLAATVLPVGLSYSFSQTTTEGVHAAIRVLIDALIVQLVGQHMGIDWSACHAQTQRPKPPPPTRETGDEWARDRLRRAGYRADGDLRSDLIALQRDKSLFPTGELDFETRQRLADDGTSVQPLRITAVPKDRQYTVKVGTRFQMEVTVTRPAHTYCFFGNERGAIRLTPARRQPDTPLLPRERRVVPSGLLGPTGEADTLDLDQPGQFSVSCVATTAPVSSPLTTVDQTIEFTVPPGMSLSQAMQALAGQAGGETARDGFDVTVTR